MVKLLQEQKIPHARCVVLIEACEESGKATTSPHHVEMLADRIGTPSLVVCLDAECGNYDQLWLHDLAAGQPPWATSSWKDSPKACTPGRARALPRR